MQPHFKVIFQSVHSNSTGGWAVNEESAFLYHFMFGNISKIENIWSFLFSGP